MFRDWKKWIIDLISGYKNYLSFKAGRSKTHISITTLGNISWYTLLVSDIRLSDISSVSTNIKNPVLLIGENLPIVYDLWPLPKWKSHWMKNIGPQTVAFIRRYICWVNFLKHSDDFAAGIRAQFEEYWASNIYEVALRVFFALRIASKLNSIASNHVSVKKKSFYAFLPFIETSIYEIKASHCYRYALKYDTWINVRVYSYLQLNLATKLIKKSSGKLVKQLVNLYNPSCMILFFAKEFVTLRADIFYLFSTL